jgi:hypothetical protein
MKRLGVVAAAVLATLPAVGASGHVTVGGSLHGRVCGGPPPVPDVVARCIPRPLTFVLVQSGRRYVVRSAVDGTYRVALPPGAYRVEPVVLVGARVARLRPLLVRVRAGRDERVDFYLDTRFAARAAS